MDAEPAAATPDHAALRQAALPILDAAIDADVKGDMRAVDAVLYAGFNLGMAELFYAAGMLAKLAILGVCRAHPDDGCTPLTIQGPTDPDLDAPGVGAAVFATRFIAAAAHDGEDRARELWLELLEPAVGPEGTEDGRRRFGLAWRLLVHAAREGLAREKVRRKLTHQHPHARRTTRRRHR